MREGTEYCWRKASDCAARAGRASDDETRKFFIRLRDSWIGVANRHGLVAWLDVGGKRRNPRRRHGADTASRDVPFKLKRLDG